METAIFAATEIEGGLTQDQYTKNLQEAHYDIGTKKEDTPHR